MNYLIDLTSTPVNRAFWIPRSPDRQSAVNAVMRNQLVKSAALNEGEITAHVWEDSMDVRAKIEDYSTNGYLIEL